MTFWSRNISVAIGVLKYYIFSSAIFGILREDSHFSKVTGWSYFSKCSPHQLRHFLSSFATRPTLHNRSPVQQKTLHFHDNEKCVKTPSLSGRKIRWIKVQETTSRRMRSRPQWYPSSLSPSILSDHSENKTVIDLKKHRKNCECCPVSLLIPR